MRDSLPAHLRHVIPEQATNDRADDDTHLPSLKNSDYQAYARPSFKSLYTLHFILPRGEVRSFQYAHLDSDSGFSGNRITLRFMGAKLVNVVIDGRNLWALYDYLHQHRIAWVKEAARDFANDKDAIVTKVTVIDEQPAAAIIQTVV